MGQPATETQRLPLGDVLSHDVWETQESLLGEVTRAVVPALVVAAALVDGVQIGGLLH